MWDGKPNMPSETSIKRVFAPGSENKSFNYRLTLKPLVKLLLDITPEATVVPASASEEQHEIAALKSVILAKEQICEVQASQIELMTKRIEKLDAEHIKDSKSRTRLTLVLVLILFILYLLAIDLPNPHYGIFRFEQFVEETAAVISGNQTGHTGIVGQAVGLLRV